LHSCEVSWNVNNTDKKNLCVQKRIKMLVKYFTFFFFSRYKYQIMHWLEAFMAGPSGVYNFNGGKRLKRKRKGSPKKRRGTGIDLSNQEARDKCRRKFRRMECENSPTASITVAVRWIISALILCNWLYTERGRREGGCIVKLMTQLTWNSEHNNLTQLIE
jgi:hypothetical protein